MKRKSKREKDREEEGGRERRWREIGEREREREADSRFRKVWTVMSSRETMSRELD